ncbi:MAG: hypothetical protein HKM93_09480 [Desulfobacteraceae bacterium]|nr:hypothetical protein [Desulfobacteraceae bacterium]
MTNNLMSVSYCFILSDNSQEIFELQLDKETVRLVNKIKGKRPDWTRLGVHQCPHCQLSVKEEAFCPVAINLVPLVERFSHIMSFEKVTAKVRVEHRSVSTETSAQEALSSLMGILIATSKCRHTDFFKPMAKFHLPFASREETIWRAASTYLLSRYLERCKNNGGIIETDDKDGPDILDGLVSIYKDIQILNDYMVNRIRQASIKDSAVNALVHLDVIAKFLAPNIEDSLEELNNIFKPFLAGRVPAT